MRPLQIYNSILLLVYGSCEPRDRENPGFLDRLEAGPRWSYVNFEHLGAGNIVYFKEGWRASTDLAWTFLQWHKASGVVIVFLERHPRNSHVTYARYKPGEEIVFSYGDKDFCIHPGRLTWNLQITQLKRKIIFQTSIFGFHVNLQGCTLVLPFPAVWSQKSNFLHAG